jgi:predicted nucleotidyltransferase component of viral defense system
VISEEEIQKLTNKFQTSQINVRREYFQHLFLSYFYQQPKAASIFFKGGTALRFLYQSPRFSEDLDFNSGLIDDREIEDLLQDTLAQIEKENIVFNLKEAKQTSGGFLAVISFAAFEQPIDIQLEISQRLGVGEKKGNVMGVTNSGYVPPYNVSAVTEEQLVAEKIDALLERKKARDFYDLYFILRSRLPILQKEELLPKILKVVNESNLNFERELKQFLPKTHWAIIKDFKSTVEREIERFR